MRQPLTYFNFDLTISAGAGRAYPLRCASPAGETQETLRLPFDDLQLENALLKLRNALLASGGRRRKVLTPEQQAVRDFGKALFDALLCGELRSRYDVSRLKAESEGKGLRLRLRVEPPELAALPWEYLYDQRTDAYLVLSHHTPLVRYLELPRPVQPLAVTPPLRLLVVVANPSGVRPLDVEREQERIEKALRLLVEEGRLAIEYLSPPTWRELQRILRQDIYHVFHFIGHGEFDQQHQQGQLLFEGENGCAERLLADRLSYMLADYHSLRLAVLNACKSAYVAGNDPFASTAAMLVRAGLPAVVAMQFAITDGAAIEFSRVFYESLAEALPVDAALAEARKAIYMKVSNTMEWRTPVLYTHAPDGQLFDLMATVKVPPFGQRTPASSHSQNQSLFQETKLRPVMTKQPDAKSEKLSGKKPLTSFPVGIKATTPTPQLSEPKPLPTLFLNKAKVQMVLVPAGEFMIGAPEGEGENGEVPQHVLYLSDYYIARTLVTNIQFSRFIADDGYIRRELWTQNGWQVKEKQGWIQPCYWLDEKWNKLDLPVVGVSWYEALAYARWAGGMLPSEAEWEKAASWDSRNRRKWRYPWGDEWDPKRCNSKEQGPGRTTLVGQYSPANDSAYGLADMAGNVWEWTRSLYREYPYNTTDGRENLEVADEWVLRGGSFSSDWYSVRCTLRDRVKPDFRWNSSGFRVVVAPSFTSTSDTNGACSKPN